MKECYNAAIKLLGKRDYSRFKLREKLLQKGFDSEIVLNVIDELHLKNYINDQTYLEGRVRHYARKKKGPYYILQKCSEEKLPVSESLIYQTYQELGLEEQTLIKEHIHQKLHFNRVSLENLDDQDRYKVYAKLTRYLMTKGFKVENIESYLN